MRILHVVQPWSNDAPAWHAAGDASDASVLACREAIEGTPTVDHAVMLLGGSAAGDRAASLGLPAQVRIAPACGHPRLARRSVGAWIEASAAANAPFDAIQCWGASLAQAVPERVSSNTRLFVLDLARGSLTHAGRSCLVPAGAPRMTERHTRRDGPKRIAFLADPPGTGSADRAFFVSSVLGACGIDATVVGDAGSRNIERAMAPARLAPMRVAPGVASGAVAIELPACSLAIARPGDRFLEELPAATWAERVLAGAAWRLGVPVVAPLTELVAPSTRGECLLGSDHPAAFARAMSRSLENPGELERLGASCRDDALVAAREFLAAITTAWGLPAPQVAHSVEHAGAAS